MIPKELTWLVFCFSFFCHWKKQAPYPPVFKWFPQNLYVLFFLIRISGTMDQKIRAKSSRIVGSCRIRKDTDSPKKKRVKNRPSSFDLEKCFLKPHSSKTQIALVTRPGGSRRRWTEAPRQAEARHSIKRQWEWEWEWERAQNPPPTTEAEPHGA